MDAPKAKLKSRRRAAATVEDLSAPPARTARAGRPAEPLITRQTAAAAALSLIDLNGLDELSLHAVAKVLGVSAPSLYHHFKDKEELLTQVARTLLDEVGQEQATWSEDWEAHTIELSLAVRRVALRHPNAAPLVLRFFPRKLMLPAYNRTLGDCPYSPEAYLVVLEVTEKFTFGSALFAAAAEAHHTSAMPPVDEARFPYLASALALAPRDDEAVFVDSLRVILAGLRVQYSQIS